MNTSPLEQPTPEVGGVMTNKHEAKAIIEKLWEKLPDIARDLISKSQDLSNPRNKNYADNPDDPLEHEPKWHQWGVITHTKMFEKFYREEIPEYLRQWGLQDIVGAKMSEQIDGMSKADLLNIAVPLHDLGKFTERKLKPDEKGEVSVSFKKHEAASGRIIRTPEFTDMMKKEFGLTDAQIEYIATCAERHYELGIVRDEAKQSELGYTFAFAQSDIFKNRAKEIISKYPGFEYEVGLLFIADSLAKSEIRIQAETDADIQAQEATSKRCLQIEI